MKWLTLALFYIAITVWDAGALNANMRAEFPRAGERARHMNRAFAISLACLPPFIIVTPAVTGFYYDGWSLSVDP